MNITRRDYNYCMQTILSLVGIQPGMGDHYFVLRCLCGNEVRRLVHDTIFKPRPYCSPQCRLSALFVLKGPEYHAWRAAKARCFNKQHRSYKWYGGRGITMCAEWREDFRAFYDYIGPRPEEPGKERNLLSLDRINNDGNYEPGNVRWATHKQQQNNRRQRKKQIS